MYKDVLQLQLGIFFPDDKPAVDSIISYVRIRHTGTSFDMTYLNMKIKIIYVD